MLIRTNVPSMVRNYANAQYRQKIGAVKSPRTLATLQINKLKIINIFGQKQNASGHIAWPF